MTADDVLLVGTVEEVDENYNGDFTRIDAISLDIETQEVTRTTIVSGEELLGVSTNDVEVNRANSYFLIHKNGEVKQYDVTIDSL
ncbi:hypothetical protein IJJ08_01160 [bacterium]|nr:hypothetical protein [bacterium]